jgi:NAD(P)-dependent dehydrogenase (short-subunit alcohol dehydrogenase family)
MVIWSVVGLDDGHNKGIVAIVTGGARGIGYEITKELVQQGIHVIIGKNMM